MLPLWTLNIPWELVRKRNLKPIGIKMKNKILLSSACLALCMGVMTLSSGAAQAQQEMGSLVYCEHVSLGRNSGPLQ